MPTPTANLFYPFFTWNQGVNRLYPQRVREGYRNPHETEKNMHVSGGGQAHTYVIGDREFIEFTFPKQSEAQRVEWMAFWDDVKDGRPFSYYKDDSYFKVNEVGLQVNDIKCGELKTQGIDSATNRTTVKIDMNMFEPTEDLEVWGQWTVFLRLRIVP